MAYPTSSNALILEDIDRQMVALKAYATAVYNDCNNAAVPVPSTRILDAFVNLRQYRASLVAAAASPGIAAYAQTAKQDATLDVVAAFNAVVAAIDAVTNWLRDNFPKAGTGELLAKRWDNAAAPTTIVDATFTQAQTAAFRTQLAALAATIN